MVTEGRINSLGRFSSDFEWIFFCITFGDGEPLYKFT